MPNREITSDSDRSRRSRWFDPRLTIGIVLVLGSVLSMLFFVKSEDATVPVLAARSTLSPGDLVGIDDLVERRVTLGLAAGKYLERSALPAAGLIVSRAIAQGELVPVSAVGRVRGVHFASVVVLISGELARSIVSGVVVDVWSAPRGDERDFDMPQVLVPAATVVRMTAPQGMVTGAASTSVELLVSREYTAEILEAVANSSAISLVPVGIPVKGSS